MNDYKSNAFLSNDQTLQTIICYNFSLILPLNKSHQIDNQAINSLKIVILSKK